MAGHERELETRKSMTPAGERKRKKVLDFHS